MANDKRRIGILRSMLEIFGIVFARFRPAQRIWGAWLVAINSIALIFVQHVEAQVTLAAVGFAVAAQALIYQRKRFIRLLGVTHLLWIPMLAWMALRIDTLPTDDAVFRAWVITLITTNSVSLVIDALDAARFIRGERDPHYSW